MFHPSGKSLEESQWPGSFLSKECHLQSKEGILIGLAEQASLSRLSLLLCTNWEKKERICQALDVWGFFFHKKVKTNACLAQWTWPPCRTLCVSALKALFKLPLDAAHIWVFVVRICRSPQRCFTGFIKNYLASLEIHSCFTSNGTLVFQSIFFFLLEKDVGVEPTLCSPCTEVWVIFRCVSKTSVASLGTILSWS